MPVPTLQVSVPIGHELLGQCIKQGQALVQRASLVGDFSDYESWKSARKQWIDPTVQALEHMYGGPREARDFVDAVSCPEDPKRWQEQYAADLKCVEEAIDLLTAAAGRAGVHGRWAWSRRGGAGGRRSAADGRRDERGCGPDTRSAAAAAAAEKHDRRRAGPLERHLGAACAWTCRSQLRARSDQSPRARRGRAARARARAGWAALTRPRP